MSWKAVTNPVTGKTEYIAPGETASRTAQLEAARAAHAAGDSNWESNFQFKSTGSDGSTPTDPSGTYHPDGSFTPKGSAQVKVAQIQPNQQQPQFDTQAYLRQLEEARRSAAMAQLQKSRDSAIGNIADERAEVAPAYYQKRNDANVQNKLSAKNFAEYIANRGLAQSGENDQARLMQNMALQGQIGGLKQQEQSVFDELGRRETNVKNAFESDKVGVEAGLQSEMLQAYINQMNADRQFGLQEAGLTGVYGGQQTLAGQQLALQNQAQQWQQNFQQSQFDFNRAITEAGVTGVFQGMPTMQRQEWEQAMRGNELDLQTKQFNLKQLQDPNSPVNQKQALELQMLQLQNQYAGPQMKLQLEQLRKSIAEIGKAPYKDQQQVQLDALKIAQSQEQLNQMKLQTQQMQGTNPAEVERQALGQLPVDQALKLLEDNRSAYIQTLGIEEFNKLLKLYREALGY